MGFFLITHPAGGTLLARNKSPQAVPQPCLLLTLLLSSSLKFCLRRMTHVRLQGDSCSRLPPQLVLGLFSWSFGIPTDLITSDLSLETLPQRPPPMLFPVPLWLSCSCFLSSTRLENIRVSKISSLPSSSQRWSRVAPSLIFPPVPSASDNSCRRLESIIWVECFI